MGPGEDAMDGKDDDGVGRADRACGKDDVEAIIELCTGATVRCCCSADAIDRADISTGSPPAISECQSKSMPPQAGGC